MNKLLALPLIAALALPLGGCPTMQDVEKAVSFTTVGVANPVTPEMLYDAENGMLISFAGLNAYKRSCVAGAIPVSCKGVIKSIQGYTKQIPALLVSARTFVKANDQVNATLVYNTIVSLIGNAKAIATANNISVGAG